MAFQVFWILPCHGSLAGHLHLAGRPEKKEYGAQIGCFYAPTWKQETLLQPHFISWIFLFSPILGVVTKPDSEDACSPNL